MSNLNPNAPEFHPSPSSASFSQFYQLPPPSFHPQPVLVSNHNFNYLPPATYAAAHQQSFYSSHNAFYATPSPPRAQIPINHGQTRRRFLGDCRFRGRGNAFRSVIQSRRRDNKYDNRGGEGSGRHENENMQQRERNRHRVTPLQRHEEQTTAMIKNIPYDCLRGELINFLDEFCSAENKKAGNEGSSADPGKRVISAYDFLYVPIDFRTNKGRGFAFVNFTNSSTAWKFFETFNDKNWNRKNWPKKIEIVCARIQGREALVDHFSRSYFECDTNEFLPVRFEPARDGSGQAVKETAVGSRWGAAAVHGEAQSS